MDTITVIVVGIVIVVGLALLYKGLKEPIDLIGRLIYRGMLYIRYQFASKSQAAVAHGEEITYG